ncbi:hypothetical protein TRV_07019 [Trichophyton verrucosum HKI 0517]|uniref:Uncharacterized protein n=1 Tax=Trichophyton verrucosum (strain HKI 0517) TaxID=663202 RepID=D4DIK9_TRIVH|nr:uncharacterized protein TRV_07019 [Trichophyton verrucosum HKI 0517]EFE38361.1 hypothetical protein TRV_07019 [Trichophyton verrucosum HKI 0517]
MVAAHLSTVEQRCTHLFSMKYLPCTEPSHCSTDRRWLIVVLPRTWLGSEEEKKGKKQQSSSFFGRFLRAKVGFLLLSPAMSSTTDQQIKMNRYSNYEVISPAIKE